MTTPYQQWREQYDGRIAAVAAGDVITQEWLRSTIPLNRIRPPAFDSMDVLGELVREMPQWPSRNGLRRFMQLDKAICRQLEVLARRKQLVAVDDGRGDGCFHEGPLYLLPEDADHAPRLGRRL